MIQNDEDILKKVDDCYQDSYNEVHPLFKKFNEYENMYWAYLPKSKNSAKSNVYDPIAFELVEHDVSHLVASLPKGYFSPMEIADANNAKILDMLIQYQFGRPQANFLQKLRNMRRRASLYGTSFGILTWKYERRLNKTTGQHYTEHNDPYFEDLDIYRCFPDPNATGVEDMQYFIYEDYTTIKQLKAENHVFVNKEGKKVQKYKNLDELEQAINDKPKTTLDAYSVNSSRRQGSNASGDVNKLLIRRYFTRDYWYSVASDYNIVIEARPNPYDHGELPIHMLRNLDYPGLLYGITDLQPLQKMITAHNQFLNMRMDNIRLIMNPTYTAKSKALKHEATWANIPNNINVVDDINDLQINYTPDATANTFVQTINYFNDQIQRRIGKTDFLSRNETGTNRTATELKIMAGEQNARKKYKAELFDTFFTGVMTQAVDLNQQFIQTKKIVRLMGAEILDQLTPEQQANVAQAGDSYFFPISPEDIQGRYDYTVATESSVMADKEAELTKLNQAINSVATYAPVLQQEGVQVNMKPLLEKYLQATGIDFTDKIFVNLEQNGTAPMGSTNGLDELGTVQGYEGLPAVPEANVDGGAYGQSLGYGA